ncbi:unnamed protein product [Anisakis simplex]|uniref:DB domain-containing protein n=1 Tax=Anisakis simplex TaxID=6269 RepID=A0A0M3K1C4_ANISI|nr:unnamed protein product [Anisakis simplex]
MFWRSAFVIAMQLLIAKSDTTESIDTELDDINGHCMQKAGLRDCAVFNKCCDFFCRNGDQQHFCLSLLGQIQEKQSYCGCTSGVEAISRRRSSAGIDPTIAVIGLFMCDYILIGLVI